MTHSPANLTYAPLGRSGWTTVFCRCCRVPVWYAANAGEARIYLMEETA